MLLVGGYLRSGKKVLSVENSSHEDFKAFVSEYVELEGEGLDIWELTDRSDLLNFLFSTCEQKPDLFIPIEDV